jgi:hypothetical protein
VRASDIPLTAKSSSTSRAILAFQRFALSSFVDRALVSMPTTLRQNPVPCVAQLTCGRTDGRACMLAQAKGSGAECLDKDAEGDTDLLLGRTVGGADERRRCCGRWRRACCEDLGEGVGPNLANTAKAVGEGMRLADVDRAYCKPHYRSLNLNPMSVAVSLAVDEKWNLCEHVRGWRYDRTPIQSARSTSAVILVTSLLHGTTEVPIVI